MKHPFSFNGRLKSFGYAFNGLKVLLKNETNAVIHLIAGIVAVILGFVFDLKPLEWIAIVFAIGFVFSMELINTAIEEIADFISPKRDERIKKIKDLSAAGVLISAIIALITGLIIFLPKFLNL
jgi:diacylglycerol kinase